MHISACDHANATLKKAVGRKFEYRYSFLVECNLSCMSVCWVLIDYFPASAMRSRCRAAVMDGEGASGSAMPIATVMPGPAEAEERDEVDTGESANGRRGDASEGLTDSEGEEKCAGIETGRGEPNEATGIFIASGSAGVACACVIGAANCGVMRMIGCAPAPAVAVAVAGVACVVIGAVSGIGMYISIGTCTYIGCSDIIILGDAM